MSRAALSTLAAAALGLGAFGCGKPLETKEEFTAAAAAATVPTTAANITGGLMRHYGSFEDTPQQLPKPFITVPGPQGGEATLSVNPVGLVVGLVGKGIMFDLEYDDYSVDGVNYLWGKVSVLANFEYEAATGEDPEANLQVSFVGRLGLSGVIRDEAQLNLKVKTSLSDLVTREGTTKLRLEGTVAASEVELEFASEDVEIDWKALEAQGG